jgi:hypothetical protein
MDQRKSWLILQLEKCTLQGTLYDKHEVKIETVIEL